MRKLAWIALIIFVIFIWKASNPKGTEDILPASTTASYWFQLLRKSNKEYLYLGVPGDPRRSSLIKIFEVKTGVAHEKPTPLPQAIGREYWIIDDKWDSRENVETAPFFLKLDIPVTEDEPFGPVPYLECNGQCNWELPGYFGLHGVNGDMERLAENNPGSSGCIRHKDEDITFLYNLLDPLAQEIRYYIEDK